MRKTIEGFRAWFEALADTARLIWPRDGFSETARISAAIARERNRISVMAMAGLTPDGSIAPPPPGTRISREPGQWKTHDYRISHKPACCPPGECKRRPMCEDIMRTHNGGVPPWTPPIVGIVMPAGKLDLRPGAIAYVRIYRDKDEQAMCEVEGRGWFIP